MVQINSDRSMHAWTQTCTQTQTHASTDTGYLSESFKWLVYSFRRTIVQNYFEINKSYRMDKSQQKHLRKHTGTHRHKQPN